MGIDNSSTIKELVYRHEESGEYVAQYKQLALRSAFQPIFDRRRKIIGVEALVRIQNQFKTVISPEHFFHSMHFSDEDKNNVEHLSLLLHIHNYSISPYGNLKLFLNILPNSSHLIENATINNHLLSDWLKSLNINKHSIVFEIMEIEYDNHQLLFSSTQNLSNSGFSIAVDDFGSRASNYERVNILSPDIIKLDRSLLTAYMDGDEEPLIQSLTFARAKGALTVIEGIETNEQYLAMSDLDIDMHQGFYLGEPDFVTNLTNSKLN
ncbi:EAL domain-containing protein [Vibrio salinus]|uniref:EAL domain-containing protein n=1 Tax=Vibrio salinus TaxID=2899784 RepID=UPI001E33D323|nr:EAL domain-containing protein [Vibrio salinus]MCE0495877.1 EAL domain-containing protein [Vibrio salinus]